MDPRLNTKKMIDPTQLSPSNSAFLGHFLQFNLNKDSHEYFPNGGTYKHTYNNEEITFELTYSLIYRICEDNPQDYRYEIIGPKLGEGKFGHVYKGLGTLI